MHSLPSDQLADYNPSLSVSQNAKAEEAQSLELLLKSGNGSDLTITCNGLTFHIHSAFMCSRSDYSAIHRDACTRFQASDPHHLDLPEEDPMLIQKMIRFIYTSDYFPFTSAYEADPSFLPVHASMYGLGEFYGVRSLKWVTADRFKKLIKLWSQGVYGGVSIPNLLAFIQAIKLVYTTTPHDDRVLRDPVIVFVPEHLHAMFGLEDFRELLNGVPDFVEEAFGEDVLERIDEHEDQMRVREIYRLARAGKWWPLENQI